MRKIATILVVVIFILGAVFGYKKLIKDGNQKETNSSDNTQQNLTIKVSSPKFAEGATIPIEYTCDDENINPPLSISGVPKEAKSLALIVDDPDAAFGTFAHWVLWNIFPDTTEIKERETPVGAAVGKNDFNLEKYRGPCPPNSIHRYFFRIYALDTILTLPAGSYREDLLKSIKGHVIAEGQLMGKYSRYQ